MKEERRQITEKLIHTFDLPQDLFLGLSNISLSGNREVYITNHHGILSYDTETVGILIKDYQIQIKGKNLHISSYDKNEITISGYIHSLEFI